MKENTFTYTARSSENPEKTATFTMHNGTVSVQLGNAVLEQLDKASQSHQRDEGISVATWVRPIAVGTVQKMLRPLPLNDFDADLDGLTFQSTAWVRTGGLRLAPITLTWDEVDNPEAAQAFVNELHERKETIIQPGKMPSIMDYWVSWLIAGVSGLVLIVIMVRLLKRFLANNAGVEII